MPHSDRAPDQPYPEEWNLVAELRVFRATAPQWSSLIGWRAQMQRKGWRLLKVGTDSSEVVAVFGRTRQELRQREGTR